MYSAKSSGNITLSCFDGSTRLHPECSPELFGCTGIYCKNKGSKECCNLFFQEIDPSINCPLQSANELYLELFNQVIKSYCSHIQRPPAAVRRGRPDRRGARPTLPASPLGHHTWAARPVFPAAPRPRLPWQTRPKTRCGARDWVQCLACRHRLQPNTRLRHG